MKSTDVYYKGFQQEPKDTQATNWDIDDASKQQKIEDHQKQKMEYEASIRDIMTEKLQTPHCLVDAEALSHISIVTTQSDQKKPTNKSNAASSKSGKSSKMASSKSAMKESTNKSHASDKLSGTSMSQT